MKDMPKFGNIANPAREVVNDIGTIADMGFDFVELNFVEPEGLPEIYRKKANRIKNAIRQYDMFAYAHAPPWADLSSLSETIRLAWLNYSKELIDISKIIGIKKLNFHAYTVGIHKTHSSKELILKQKRVQNFVASLRELVKYGDRKGVRILYENTNESYSLFASVQKRISNSEITLDVAHAFTQGGMSSVRKFLSLEKQIDHMHISDNKGKGDDHIQLGKGNIDFSSVVKILEKMNYNKTITFEIFTNNRRDPEKAMKYFKNLWVKS